MSDQTRRKFLHGLGAFALAGVLTRTGAARAGVPVAFTPEEHFLRRMLRGIPVGESFYGDWFLLDAYPPMAGGVSVVIAHGYDGEPLRVDIVRRDEPTIAPAFTDHLEMFAMDGGRGRRKLPLDLREALCALADLVGDNDAQYHLAGRLLTHRERLDRYPRFMRRAASELQPVHPDFEPQLHDHLPLPPRDAIQAALE